LEATPTIAGSFASYSLYISLYDSDGYV